MPDLNLGLILTLIGMGIVFSILGLMVLSLMAMAKVCSNFTNESISITATGEKTQAFEHDQVEADHAETHNFDEIIAVISIALAAYYSEEIPKVTTIRQLPRTTNGWGLAGRMKIIEGGVLRVKEKGNVKKMENIIVSPVEGILKEKP